MGPGKAEATGVLMGCCRSGDGMYCCRPPSTAGPRLGPDGSRGKMGIEADGAGTVPDGRCRARPSSEAPVRGRAGFIRRGDTSGGGRDGSGRCWVATGGMDRWVGVVDGRGWASAEDPVDEPEPDEEEDEDEVEDRRLEEVGG